MSDTSDPNKRRLRLIIVLAVLVGAIILLIVSEIGSIGPADTPDDATTTTGARELVVEPVAG